MMKRQKPDGGAGEQLPPTRVVRRRVGRDSPGTHRDADSEPPTRPVQGKRLAGPDVLTPPDALSPPSAPGSESATMDAGTAESLLPPTHEGEGEGTGQEERDALCILHVLAPAPAGGLESVVRQLAGGHGEQGHHVHVAAVVGEQGWDHPFVTSIAATRASIIPLRLPDRAYHRERDSIRAWCRVLRPDVVHTHGYRTDVVDAGVARSLGIPTVTTVHGLCGGGWRNRLYERIQVRAMRRFDAVVAVSRPLAAHLVQAGVRPERLQLIPNAYAQGSEPLDRALARRLLGVDDERLLIGWVGRLSPEKGPELMIRAVAALASHPVSVAVIGDGSERSRLRSLAWELGVADRIHWHGTIPDAGRLFPAFDLVLLSSQTEGTPMVLLEAMAAEVPIVATRVGGVEDLLTADDAFLVPPGDPASLANAVLDACHDQETAHARARTAKQRLLAHYSLPPWLDRYEQLYRELMHYRSCAARR